VLSGAMLVPVSSHPRDHGPFRPGQGPRPFPLGQCPIVDARGPRVMGRTQVLVYGRPGAPAPRLRTTASDAYPGGVDVDVLGARDQMAASRVHASDFPAPLRPESAGCADLNGDGALDFVLFLPSGGNGLGGQFAHVVVVLSSPATYRTWVVATANPEPEDVRALPDGAHAALLTASFVNNEHVRESRRHSYWVYNLLAVRGDALELANTLVPGFPKWVWYTIRPNHAAAPLAAAEQERLWARRSEPLFWAVSPAGR
jgi:hypothetical protein